MGGAGGSWAFMPCSRWQLTVLTSESSPSQKSIWRLACLLNMTQYLSQSCVYVCVLLQISDRCERSDVLYLDIETWLYISLWLSVVARKWPIVGELNDI